MKKMLNFSYYALYLKNYLRDIGDARADDNEFINAASERAEVEFEDSRLSGLTVDQSKERAMSVLLSGLSEG